MATLTLEQKEFVIHVLNDFWNNLHRDLERKDLGDLERKLMEEQQKRSLALIRELNSPSSVAKVSCKNVKDSGAWYEAALELGISEEKAYSIFEYGEYANFEIEIDKNLNIVGGKIHPHKDTWNLGQEN
jgi:hypothetical protein